jgi:hypothetical protein
VTAGLRCAPLDEADANTPVNTAMAHPKVITIHPPLLPLVLFSNTLATTPSPKVINKAVPMISEMKGDIAGSLKF